MLAKPIKSLLCCLGVASMIFTSCKKNDNTTTVPFSEGYYTGTITSSSVQEGNTIQSVAPANITFTNGNYSENNVPYSHLPYTDFIPFTGIYELKGGNTTMVLTYVNPVPLPFPAPGFLTGQYAISYKADSLILTQTLPDGLSSYQFRLKKFVR